MAKPQFQTVKGTRDILPPDSALWNRVEQTAREVFATYNFGEIRLPIFEDTEVFARAVGQETDIVSKEMYSFSHDPLQNRLLGLVSQIMSSQVQLDHYLDLQEVNSYVHQLSNESRGAFNDDVIPNSPENHRIVLWLETRAAKLETEFREALISNSVEDLDWYTDREEIQHEIAKLDLGSTLSLRPEATASVCRAYIQHGMKTLPGDVRLYYMGPMFRRERPQKGRYRQFYQIGAEVLGQGDHPAIDAEVIEMVLVFIQRCGLEGCKLTVNSIGCPGCRPAYVEKLQSELRKVEDRLGPDSRRRIETNPLRVLDSKVKEEQEIIAALPTIADHLCDECKERFDGLQNELNAREIEYKINHRLVRGLDYYRRTTFEITAPGLGSQDAVCGGGRYDGLMEMLGGPPTKGIGFSIGTDRLMLALQETGKLRPAKSLTAYVVWMGDAGRDSARSITRKLRDAGVSAEMLQEERKLGKALDVAAKSGARFAIIIGDDEIAQGMYMLRDLNTSKQEPMAEDALLERIGQDRYGDFSG